MPRADFNDVVNVYDPDGSGGVGMLVGSMPGRLVTATWIALDGPVSTNAERYITCDGSVGVATPTVGNLGLGKYAWAFWSASVLEMASDPGNYYVPFLASPVFLPSGVYPRFIVVTGLVP